MTPDEMLRAQLLEGHGQHLVEQAVLSLTRYLLVLRIGPAGIGRKRYAEPLDPSVIADKAYYVATALFSVAVSRWMLEKSRSPDEHGFLQAVKLADLNGISPNQRTQALSEVRRMNLLHDRGWWLELPDIGTDNVSTTAVAGPAPPASEERKRDVHLPLPDEFVSEMGQRSIWLIESLAPTLLELTERIRDIWARTDDGSLPRAVVSRRRSEVPKLLAQWEWRTPQGHKIERPPFDIRLSRSKDKRKSDAEPSWPPRTFAAILGLLGNLQLAHLFVVSLSTGGRKSETLDLRRDCVVYRRDGLRYATGRTFKLVRQHDGASRDWVLPELAVVAIEQQLRLVTLVESIGTQSPASKRKPTERESTDHLWVQVSGSAQSDRSQPLTILDKAFRAYARALGMDEQPGGQWLRPHRFRKTVARLAALALTQAPKVLMDAFGHKSIEMTLYYILSDKSLQADIERVGRELRVLRARAAVEAIVEAENTDSMELTLGGYGGPAAFMISNAIQVQRERLHQRGEQWGAQSASELAEVLTLQGKSWEVVRRGVICTKLQGSESGPCNKSKGRPEPSRCQTDCRHRLEEAFLREDVEAALASAVEEFAATHRSGDDLMSAMWAGQIRAHLVRFEDIRARWTNHPMVMKAFESQDEPRVEAAE